MFCTERKELSDNQPVQDNILAKRRGEHVHYLYKRQAYQDSPDALSKCLSQLIKEAQKDKKKQQCGSTYKTLTDLCLAS